MVTNHFTRYSDVLEIVGDIMTVRVPAGDGDRSAPGTSGAARFGHLAIVEDGSRHTLAQIIAVDRDRVSLQLFSGTKGFSTAARVRFPGRAMEVACSEAVLGRAFSGAGEPMDGGPDLAEEPRVGLSEAPVNPMRRVVASKMIRTNVPMIDLFNCLVESQKISIFSGSGEPYNSFLARIGIQADADVVVFCGLGLIFDDYYLFRRAFEDGGVMGRTVMIANLASHPIVERILAPDVALTLAERFAVEEGQRVLVLMTDMTAFADALKEIAVATEQVPSNRGYPGDLYSQLARRYEKACDYARGGSLTILSVTTMPGDDVTHPVPDNTGYITEGQFYLRNASLDPFGSLSRLKQHVIGKETREDHNQVMSTMIRLYAGAVDAEQKQAMAFDLTEADQRLLRFGELFRRRFMGIEVDTPLEEALDLAWQTMGECFEPDELLIRQELIDKYYRKAS